MPAESRYEGTIRRIAAEIGEAEKKAVKSKTRPVGDSLPPRKSPVDRFLEKNGYPLDSLDM